VSLLSPCGLCMSRSRLLDSIVGSILLSLVAKVLPCCLTVCRWSLLFFQRCRWRLLVGGLDSRWLGPVLESLLGGTVLRTTSLGWGVCPCHCRGTSAKMIFCLKLLLLELCLFQIQNLSCNKFNYYYTLSILMFIYVYLCILASSRIPWLRSWRVTLLIFEVVMSQPSSS
jgi:hypothetical protein